MLAQRKLRRQKSHAERHQLKQHVQGHDLLFQLT